MPGYSKRTLFQKLGLKPGMHIHIRNAPKDYLSTLNLPKSINPSSLKGTLDFIQIFVDSLDHLKKEFPKAKACLSKAGMLWVSWAKKSSPLYTDLTDNLVREVGTQSGLVDVKVCAVTEDWSGLKFVYRLED